MSDHAQRDEAAQPRAVIHDLRAENAELRAENTRLEALITKLDAVLPPIYTKDGKALNLEEPCPTLYMVYGGKIHEIGGGFEFIDGRWYVAWGGPDYGAEPVDTLYLSRERAEAANTLANGPHDHDHMEDNPNA